MLALCWFFLYFGLSSESDISLRLTDPIRGKLGEICANGDAFVVVSHENRVSYVLVDIRDVVADDMNSAELSRLMDSRVLQAKLNHSGSFLHTDSVALVVPYESLAHYVQISRADIGQIVAVNEKRIDVNNSNVLTCLNSTLEKIILKDSSRTSATGIIAETYLPHPLTQGENIASFLLLLLMSIGSIILASIMLIRDHETFLLQRLNLANNSATNPCIKKSITLITVCISASIILLVFFFYDVMVHFFQILFLIGGAVSMTFVFSIFLQGIFPSLKRATTRICKRNFNIFTFFLFLLSLAFTLTWYFYRNDPNVGWIMQNTVAMFLVIAILIDVSCLISFKLIVILFGIFIIYDVFFVFLTPFFFKQSSTSTTTPAPVSNDTLIRTVRSSESIMEAVATGSAGSSGEMIPLVFKIFPGYLFPHAFNVCNTRQYFLLGFGDAILPGILCAFLAFYDACWKRKIPYNFLASIIGYCIGAFITAVVVMVAKSGQPALLYLCPCTLGVTLLSALIVGGRSEIRNLWLSNLPSRSELLSPSLKIPEEEKLSTPVPNVGDHNTDSTSDSIQPNNSLSLLGQ